jgi:hypothetical protein
MKRNTQDSISQKTAKQKVLETYAQKKELSRMNEGFLYLMLLGLFLSVYFAFIADTAIQEYVRMTLEDTDEDSFYIGFLIVTSIMFSFIIVWYFLCRLLYALIYNKRILRKMLQNTQEQIVKKELALFQDTDLEFCKDIDELEHKRTALASYKKTKRHFTCVWCGLEESMSFASSEIEQYFQIFVQDLADIRLQQLYEIQEIEDRKAYINVLLS